MVLPVATARSPPLYLLRIAAAFLVAAATTRPRRDTPIRGCSSENGRRRPYRVALPVGPALRRLPTGRPHSAIGQLRPTG